MKSWKHTLLLLALEMPGLGGGLLALSLRGCEHLLQVIAIGAMSMCGPGVFLAGVISLLGTRTFLRKAIVAKGSIGDIAEITPTGARESLLPGRIVTIQFWTEQEESITFQSHTFQTRPETAPRSIPVLYESGHPFEAKIHSFEGLWLAPGLIMVLGTGLTCIYIGLFGSVLK